MGHILRSGGTLWLEPYQLSFRVHRWYFKSLSRHSVSMWPKVLILSMPMAQQWIFSWNPSFLFLSLLVETRLKDNPHWIAEVSDTHVGNPELLWVVFSHWSGHFSTASVQSLYGPRLTLRWDVRAWCVEFKASCTNEPMSLPITFSMPGRVPSSKIPRLCSHLRVCPMPKAIESFLGLWDVTV